MTKHFHKCIQFTAIIVSLFWLTVSNIATAGICDISGGSGIGGTGSPMHGSGIGGTGAVALNSGIGGTGKPIKKTGTGIGGTGFVINGSGIGGTGQSIDHNGVVIGTITGFGSICVNGIEIHYTADTPLQRGGQNVNPDSSFAIGQVVAVGVSGLGNEVIAKEMHIIHAATGPISTIDFVKGEIEVLGQKIHFDINSPSSNEIHNLHVGSYVEVSGLRDSVGSIIASRIDATSEQEIASLHGPITSISSDSFNVHGVKVLTPLPSGLSLGQNILVSGGLNTDGFKADGIIIQQQTLSAETGGLVSVEGYLDNSNTIRSVEIAGRTINIPTEFQKQVSQIPNHERVIVTGRLAEGNIIQMDHMIIDIIAADIEDTRHEDEHNSHAKNEVKEHEDSDEHKPEQLESDEIDDHQEIESPDSKEYDEDKGHEIEEHETPEAPEVEEHEAAEFEAPEMPDTEEHDTPEFEAPEMPDTEEHDTPEFEAPEVPEIEEVETPEFEAPEVPEIEDIETPEFEAPEVPEIEEIETPEFEAPEVPEIEEIETPEFEVPEIPEFEEPEVPEFEVPEVPEIEEVETPEFEAPEVPEYELPES